MSGLGRSFTVFNSSCCRAQGIVESNFAKLVDFINSDRICSLEVPWILEDIMLIRDQFVSISFVFVLLKCNRATLALASATKENEEAIISLSHCTT